MLPVYGVGVTAHTAATALSVSRWLAPRVRWPAAGSVPVHRQGRGWAAKPGEWRPIRAGPGRARLRSRRIRL